MNDVRETETTPSSRPSARAPHEIQADLLPRPFGPTMIVNALRRRVRVFGAVLGCVLALLALALLLQAPRYTATAEVVLDTSGGVIAPSGAGHVDRSGAEVQILRSREMALAVATALRLDDRFLAAEAAVPLAFAGRLIGAGSAVPRDGAELQRRIVDRLTRGLMVERLADAYSLTIGYTAADAAVAARIANQYADEYATGRLAGSGVAASPLDRPYARIISRAEPPMTLSSPRWWRTMGYGLLAGTLAGLIAAVLAERRFSGITSGHEIEKRLGLPHLGSVPTLQSVLPHARSPLDAMVEEPMSGFAEAFRGVMMAIRQAGGRGTQVIAISSALPNEGKTTVAACLARSVALGGERVVLIDCDVRRRDSSAMFGFGERRPGLIEVLRYEATLDEALVRDEASGAWILPVTGLTAEVSDLLTGPRMVGLIEDLKQRFKRVLIDTAPILAISSTRAIATMVDLMVLVVRWRATADHAVLTALRLLPNDHVRIGGIVLSQVDINRQVKFGHGDPTFYYQQYSQYYS